MNAASLTWLRAQTQNPKGEPVNRDVVVRSTQIRELLDEREALLAHCSMLVRICDEAADGAFNNGNTYNGLDEGDVLSRDRIQDARGAIAKATGAAR